MADIEIGTIVTIKPGVSWRGHDLGNKEGLVIDSNSYVLVKIDGINEEVKLLRYEIASQQSEDDYFSALSEIFNTPGW